VVDDVAAPAVSDAVRRAIPVLAVMAAVAAVLTQPGTAVENMVAGAAVVPFVLWAGWPDRVPPLAVVVAVGAAELFAQRAGELEPLMFLVCISATVIGIAERSGVRLVVSALAAAAVPVIVAEAHDDGILFGVWIMGSALSLVLGWGFRRQLELAAELDATRQALARQVVADEKRRIARDVHDLVGHGLAAVLLHVTGARHVLRRDIDAADAALADAEVQGRRSLRELRRTLTLLRASEGNEAAALPLPDAGDIADVVQVARASGIDAEFKLVGDPGRVDPVVGLSLHRVAVEALTNAQRHAPRAATDVELAVQHDAVVLTVESIGPLGPASDADVALDGERPRYGVVGMRERMVAVGGALEAGPTPTGWRVRGCAPLVPAGPDVPSARAEP
jgi:signal transduction histidine kinase